MLITRSRIVKAKTRELPNVIPKNQSGRVYKSIPAGTWTDDSSLTLALLDSINICKTIDLTDIMERF
ncbi:MAG: ADP-ribosylglycohydrolase family protein [Lachnospiraceae bacterium]|nr:ADP-ribosylglycohydrolase family protein [Lachnospiraceae bacterium]